MDKILIIGSNSFSGANFCNYALNQGMHTIGVSRSVQSSDIFLPYKWSNNGELFYFHQIDLNKDQEKLIDLIWKETPAYIVNFAAQSMVAESWDNPIDWYMTNTISTIKLHDQLRKVKFLKRYVHITTPEVYGSCAGNVKENWTLNPSTPYAASRAAADLSLRTFFYGFGFPVIFTRASNVYGPGQQLYRIIPKTILSILMGKKIQLHGGGMSTRSFIHIKDVCDATWKIMLFGNDGDTYHISTNEMISIRELVKKICQKLNCSFYDCVEVVDERLGKDAAYHLDSCKIRNELSWDNAISLDEGINECINWTKKNLEELSKLPQEYIHRP
jgi:dTDP-glucose 4,6-dehydratase